MYLPREFDKISRKVSLRLVTKMRVGPLGIWELLAILAIILLIFGAKRLPEIGASLGRGIRTFKSSVTEEDEKDERDEREPQSADRRSDNNGL